MPLLLMTLMPGKMILGFIVFLLSFSAHGQPHTWMKKEDPNQLGYYITLDDMCPFDLTAVKSKVEGVFVRSRIKPLPQELWGELYLGVRVSCMDIPDDRSSSFFIFTVDIRFGSFMSRVQRAAILYGDSYGAFGQNKKGPILELVTGNAERAITDYLKANFDL